MPKMRFTITQFVICVAALLAPLRVEAARSSPPPAAVAHERMVEWTIESRKQYADPFNDVDVDVIFSKNGHSWRVPAFWRGLQQWTVRFAPPTPGEYNYHLESTDKRNPDLNGHPGHVVITAYAGGNMLLKHGPPRVSENRRYFEYADGTPFFWLGDTWWTGLSSRLPWEGFQRLAADRKAKGFTVVQTVAGLVPYEETCPVDPGCQNEGGPVWEPGFARINPQYFDSMDRRIQHLVAAELTPAIVGAWENYIDKIGPAKLKKHWRYLIARYGAYPVFWIVGGEVFDPPKDVFEAYSRTVGSVVDTTTMGRNLGGWTAVARYVRATDPYHHPLAAHERSIEEPPLQEESLTDFRLFQPGHSGWSSIAIEIAQLNEYFARTDVTKPLVVGEIGYEMLGRTHLEDFQRAAFWLAMLNGAAGMTYGAVGTWESYTADEPFQRVKWSLLTWEEGMNLPGSYQVGLSAKFLRQYAWWNFQPHPDWIAPHGTTLLEPRGGVDRFHIDLMGDNENAPASGLDLPVGEWTKHKGNFRLPYAAGVPGELRVIYLPYADFAPHDPLTVFGLEPGIVYHAYYWEPSLGVRVDLGDLERSSPGDLILKDEFTSADSPWTDHATPSTRGHGSFSSTGQLLAILEGTRESNLVIAVDAHSNTDAGLIVRYRDNDNYVGAVFSASDSAIYLFQRKDGHTGKPIGRTLVSGLGTTFRLTAEFKDGMGIVSLRSDGHTTTTPIVSVGDGVAGETGLMCACVGATQSFANFELRKGSKLSDADPQKRRLYDATGEYRGTLTGPAGRDGMPHQGITRWDDYGKEKYLLLDAYRPEAPLTRGDWVLVLDTKTAPAP